MKDDAIREYAVRKARQEAKAFMTRQANGLSNEAVVKIICLMLDELEKEIPSKALCLDFLDVLHSVN